jgi:hypothetical protein
MHLCFRGEAVKAGIKAERRRGQVREELRLPNSSYNEPEWEQPP